MPIGGPLWSPAVSLPHRSFQLFVSLLLSQQRIERIVQDIFACQQYIISIAKHMLIIISLPEMTEAGEICLCMVIPPHDSYPRFKSPNHFPYCWCILQSAIKPENAMDQASPRIRLIEQLENAEEVGATFRALRYA